MNLTIKTILVIGCLSTLLTTSLWSQDKWKLKLNNEVDLTTRYYGSSDDGSLDSYQGEARTFHNLKLKANSKFSLHVTAKSVLNINSPERNRVWINQAYMTLRRNNLSLKAGKQTIKWGTTTGISVMDLANQYDYYDYLNTDKEYLGLWATKIRYNTGPINWILHVAETSNRSILHFDGNRWTRMPTTTRLPQDPNGVYSLELESIHTSVESNKPQVSLEVDFDIESVSTRLFTYQGSNDIPQRSIAINAVEGKNVNYDLLLKYHDLKIYGIGQSTYVNDWNIWYELGHVRNQSILPSAGLVSDNYWNLTVGMDRMFSFEDPEKSLKLLVQYCNISGANETSNAATNLDQIFSNAILTELQYTHNYNLKFDLRTVFDIGKKGLYLNPRIKHKVSDQLSLQLSSDILLGSDDSFWGHYNDNTRLSFQVQYAIQ